MPLGWFAEINAALSLRYIHTEIFCNLYGLSFAPVSHFTEACHFMEDNKFSRDTAADSQQFYEMFWIFFASSKT